MIPIKIECPRLALTLYAIGMSPRLAEFSHVTGKRLIAACFLISRICPSKRELERYRFPEVSTETLTFIRPPQFWINMASVLDVPVLIGSRYLIPIRIDFPFARGCRKLEENMANFYVVSLQTYPNKWLITVIYMKFDFSLNIFQSRDIWCII